ncbi:hypothetical protein ABVT39_002533 [Epinephelus coioides]
MEGQRSKGLNFTTAETHALLDGVRTNYECLFGTFSTPDQSNVSARLKSEIWADITAQVNATGSGQFRSVEQVKLRWKNLKQKATKDHSEAKNPQTGNKPYKGVGEPVDEPLNLSSDYMPLTPVEADPSEVEPSAGASTAPPHAPQEVRGPEPERRRRKRHAGTEDAYEKLLRMETERAVRQIQLADEQLKLTLLQQKETELKIKLLEKKLSSDL